MKPTKSKVFCRNCNRHKMLFETEKKANLFIQFNQEEIQEVSGYSPQRSYFCLFCGGWHVTSIKEEIGTTKNESLYQAYTENRKKKAGFTTNTPKTFVETQEMRLVRIKNEMFHLDEEQQVAFIQLQIEKLTHEISALQHSNEEEVLAKLKIKQQELQAVRTVKNQLLGVDKKNLYQQRINQKQIDEWRIWAEEKVRKASS